MEAGKGVLCEKPFTLDYNEAQKMVETFRKNDVFLMEGMWTRFLPVIKEVTKLLKEGKIGR